MRSNYRYILDPSSKKYICRNCGRKTLVIFIDTQTGELMYNYGRCDREIKCGFFRHPSKEGFNNFITDISPKISFERKKEPDFHSVETINTFNKQNNNFVLYLNKLFGESLPNKICNKFKIGTLPDFKNGTIFWQIDQYNRIHGGKVIQYNSNGKRTKQVTWIHAYLIKTGVLKSFNLSQCLFGLHQINKDKTSPIGIVESEKTACIMTGVFPKMVWMACGSKTEFKSSKLLPIKSRKIIAYPDYETQKNGCSSYEIWKKKAKEMNAIGFDIFVSDLMENRISKSKTFQGMDLADFFI